MFPGCATWEKTPLLAQVSCLDPADGMTYLGETGEVTHISMQPIVSPHAPQLPSSWARTKAHGGGGGGEKPANSDSLAPTGRSPLPRAVRGFPGLRSASLVP